MDSDRNEPRGGAPSRRGVLKAGLAAAAVAGATGWRAAPRGQAGGGLPGPGSLPHPHLPAGTDTIPQIRHIVVVMLENHSYDNHLGMLQRPGADGFQLGSDGTPLATNPYPDGRIQHAFRMPTTCQLPGQPAQDWANTHIQYDGGALDGFVRSGSGPVAMGYWQQADLPFYYSLASAFPVADRYFASVPGQTFPNRRYLLAATSIGQVNDTTPGTSDYPPNGTLMDRLDAHGLSWRDYYTSLPTALLYPPLYFRNFGTKVVPIAQFFIDAAAGRLPSFCLVEPEFSSQSEENPQNIIYGEEFATQAVRAVMSGPGWPHTLLILTFDEHGGYYDHVPPPAAVPPDDIPPDVPAGQAFDGFARYGFRVPCVVVSPWARRDYVSHQVFDHASICRLVEAKWNLPAMTRRDAAANDMLDLLDLRRPAFLRPPALAAPRFETDPTAALCSLTGPGTIPPPGSVSG